MDDFNFKKKEENRERETSDNHEVGVGVRVHTAYYSAQYSIENLH